MSIPEILISLICRLILSATPFALTAALVVMWAAMVVDVERYRKEKKNGR